jgi:phosphinothricin acetyltransferase
MIRDARAEDAEAICGIYNYYVLGTTITFEEKAVSPEEMRARIEEKTESHAWLVHEEEGRILGYAYGSSWRERPAYRRSCELTVYLDREAGGRGLGKALYEALLTRLKEKGFHVALGCVALPNERSVRLHESLGFTKVAHFSEAGLKFGAWVDVGFWEKIL